MGVDGRETGGAGQVWCMGLYAHGKREATRDRGEPRARRGAASTVPDPPSRQRRGCRMSIVIYYSEIFIRRSRCSETGHSTHTRPRVNEHSRLPCALPCHAISHCHVPRVVPGGCHPS